MDEATRTQLSLIVVAVETLTEHEGQDQGLVIEMSQHMLHDLIHGGELAPMVDYVARYCDVLDSREDAGALAARIESGTEDGGQRA